MKKVKNLKTLKIIFTPLDNYFISSIFFRKLYLTGLIIIITIICGSDNFYAQNPKLDSLWKEYKTAKHDTTRIKLLNEEIGYLYESINPDSAIFFYRNAILLSEQNINQKKSNIKIFLSFKAISLRYIGIVYSNQGRYTQALEYYLKSLKIYDVILTQNEANGKNLSEKQFAQKGLSACYNNIGIAYKELGNYTLAIEYYLKSLKITEEILRLHPKLFEGKKLMSQSYYNIGNVHRNQGNYDKAIAFYLKSLEIKEELNDKKGMAMCYGNIGIVYQEQESYDMAIEFYLKDLKLSEELNDKKGMSYCYNNIGNVHKNQRNYKKSIDYYLKFLTTTTELKDKKGLSMCCNNLGTVYAAQGNYNKAIEFYLKSLEIKEELNDKNGIATVYGNIASLNISLSDSAALSDNQRLNYLNKAIEYGTKSITLAKEIKAMPRENASANTLMNAYKKLGNFKKSIEYAEIFIATKDSMFSEEKTKSLAEMGAKYESEKRELTIQKLEKEQLLQNETIARKNAESKKQRILIFSFLAGFIIILVFSIFLYRLFIQKKLANVILSQQKEEISAQRDEIESQRDLVTEQKEHIEEIHKEVTDSINYAERIQRSFLATKELLDENLNSSLRGTASPELSSKYQIPNFKNQEEEREKNYEQLNIRTIEQSNQEQQTSNLKLQTSNYFVFFHPKDVVSGDFYWAGKLQNGNFALATADSTGHGVPGAIMSILNISSLEKAVELGLNEPSEILNHTRKTIIERLKKDGSVDGGKDGMDASLICFDFENLKLTYSAANNTIWIVRTVTQSSGLSVRDTVTQSSGLLTDEPEVRVTGDAPANHEQQTTNNELFELFPDKMPVGKHDKDQISFTQHEFQLQKGDVIYTLTDGFPDQFGGAKGKKFMSKSLKELLIANCLLTMEEQKEILEKTFENWINFNEMQYEQTDDITIIGIRI